MARHSSPRATATRARMEAREARTPRLVRVKQSAHSGALTLVRWLGKERFEGAGPGEVLVLMVLLGSGRLFIIRSCDCAGLLTVALFDDVGVKGGDDVGEYENAPPVVLAGRSSSW